MTATDQEVIPVASNDTDRRVTIVDVARHAGVSTAAASKVLRRSDGVSDAMRERVERSMAELDYRPLASARGMRGKTFTLGVLVMSFANPYTSQIIDGITSVVAPAGYELLAAQSGQTAEAHQHTINAFRDRRMDGLLLITPLGTQEYLSQIGRGVPTVVIGRHGPGDHFDTVASDDMAGSRLIVDHLTSQGHRHIAYVQHAPSTATDPRLPQNVRTEGYLQAMRDAGLAEHIDVVPTMWDEEGGHQAARALLARNELPTAIHAGADVVAFGALNEFWLARRDVPGEIAVAGYDNTSAASFEPIGLTSVDQFGSRMGAMAAELLLERIGGRAESRHDLILPELIVRRTTSAPARVGG